MKAPPINNSVMHWLADCKIQQRGKKKKIIVLLQGIDIDIKRKGAKT